ncbi:bZIP transcription factor TRAB1-like [Zingiber officinale]|uniref:bZIP transcription factor TRAB1-like n=1 Tax=Zingiber officinale TaxID=94328 RepID=UPI001C4C477D|nr:bZIP transcription factor TRAB1-like [Zingiber officinale]XP_042470058.1 bZIP transcription factor TRAB1-like [Zingiber officinale]
MNFNKHAIMGGAVAGGDGSGAEANGGSRSIGLARQSSVYSLTFDEFQSSLGGVGKDFGSMNMDELIKNIWTAEESQTLASAVGSRIEDAGLQKQGSFTFPRTLSQKSVEEVWRDLVYPVQGPPATAGASYQHQHQQQTLGEITLEEFLVRAGVVREEPVTSRSIADAGDSSGHNRSIRNALFGDLQVANNASGVSLGFLPQDRSSRDAVVSNPTSNSAAAALAMMVANDGIPLAAPRPRGDVNLASPRGIRGAGLMGFGEVGLNNGLMPGAVGLGAGAGIVTTASPVNHLPSDSLPKSGGDQSSILSVPYVFSGGLRGRKSGAGEKVYERRQRRMIKNRESAARSRARKQAYTMELELEVANLKEVNQELQKKQAEKMEMQQKQILQMINEQRGPKKPCLRRTQTGPW